MDKRLLEPLNAFEASLNTLVHSLTATNTFVAAPKAAQDLVTADDDLTQALIDLKRHQDNYQEILRLRAEKEALRDQIKNTIYECVRLKKDLGDIDSRIVDESDTEDEEEAKQQHPIEYETLLAFATRIGKHSAKAAQEAEKESDRSLQEQQENREQLEVDHPISQLSINGNGKDVSVSVSGTIDRPTASQSIHTQEAQDKVNASRNTRLWERSRRTAPFPDATILRHGILGQLQVMREDIGEEAVSTHVEKLVRDSELKGSKESISSSTITTEETKNVSAPAATPAASLDPPVQQQQRVQPKPQINMDLPSDDDDDD